MSDFADIPAVEDAFMHDEEEEEEEEEEEVVEDDEEEPQKGGKYHFNGRYIYVTWSSSKIDSKEEFEQKLRDKLKEKLPPGVRMYGGRELHKDGTPHYHMVVSFPGKKHLVDAAATFSIEGDTNAIRFEKLKPRQSRQRTKDFLDNTQAYCEKDGDTFGERLSYEGSVAEQKKRKWQEIIDEPDEETAWSMLRELDPRSYMVNHPALDKAMSRTKRVKATPVERERPVGKFRVPRGMELWMDKYVIQRKWQGRPKSLVIVGDPMVGKSAWAESQGNPIVMNSGWCVKSIFRGATHIVVSDVKPAAFGICDIFNETTDKPSSSLKRNQDRLHKHYEGIDRMNDKEEVKFIEDLISQCNEAGLQDLKKRLDCLLYD